jgi:hypothetical protein
MFYDIIVTFRDDKNVLCDQTCVIEAKLAMTHEPFYDIIVNNDYYVSLNLPNNGMNHGIILLNQVLNGKKSKWISLFTYLSYQYFPYYKVKYIY